MPAKYTFKSVTLEVKGEVDKKDGVLILRVTGSDVVITLKKMEWIKEPQGEEPYARLKRQFDDGATKFTVTGEYGSGDKGKSLAVTAAERQ